MTSRVQSGVPAGGQFAPTPHAEADVSLSEVDPAAGMQDPYFFDDGGYGEDSDPSAVDDRPWSWETFTEEVGAQRAAELYERSDGSLGKAMALAISDNAEPIWAERPDGVLTTERNGHTITVKVAPPGDASMATVRVRSGNDVISYALSTEEAKANAIELSDGLAGAEMRAARPMPGRSAGFTDGHEWHELPFADIDVLDLPNNGHRLSVDSGERSVRWATITTRSGGEFKLYSEPGETRDDMRRRAVSFSNDLAAAEREREFHERAAKDLFRGIDLDNAEPPF